MTRKISLLLCLLVVNVLTGCITKGTQPTQASPWPTAKIVSPFPALTPTHRPTSAFKGTQPTQASPWPTAKIVSPFHALTPTPRPTSVLCATRIPTIPITVPADWPVYENAHFGICLRYPSTFYYQTWDVSPFPDKLLSVTFQNQKYHDQEIPQVPNVALIVWNNVEELAIETWLARHSTTEPFGTEVDLEFPVFFLLPEAPVEHVTVNDIKGLYFASDVMGLTGYDVIFPHKKWIVQLGYGAFGPDDLGAIFSTMLGSLEFK